jgi:hypothetical protein
MCDNRMYHIMHSALEVSPNTALSKVSQCLNVLKIVTSHHLFAKPPDRPKLSFESTHPYEHNLDTKKTIKFAGATRLEVNFDSECRTERECDYLRFFYRGKQIGPDKYHGRPDYIWPKLVVDGDELTFTFHSDGATNDWGYKFEVTAFFATEKESFFSLGQRIKDTLAHVICNLCISSGVFVIPCFPHSELSVMQGSPDLTSESQTFISLAVNMMHIQHFRDAFKEALFEAISFASPSNSLIFSILCEFLKSDEHIYDVSYKRKAVFSESPPEWTPSIKERVLRGGDWKWHDQDAGTYGTITSVDNQKWVGVRWDLGTSNFYRYDLDGNFDIRGCPQNAEASDAIELGNSQDTKILPNYWFMSVVSNIAHSLFDSSFDSSLDATYMSLEGIEELSCRILDFIDSFSSKIKSSCQSISSIASMCESVVAQLVVHACFCHRLFESIPFLSATGSNQKILLLLNNQYSSSSFRNYFAACIDKNAGKFQQIFACLWAASFAAIEKLNVMSGRSQQLGTSEFELHRMPFNDGIEMFTKQTVSLVDLLGAFINSSHLCCNPPLSTQISVSNLPLSSSDVCVLCDLPASLHLHCKCLIGKNKGSLGQWPKVRCERAVSQGANIISKVTASSASALASRVCSADLNSYWKSDSAEAGGHWVRLFLKAHVNPSRLLLFCEGTSWEGFPKVVNVRCASTEAKLEQSVIRSVTAENPRRDFLHDNSGHDDAKLVISLDLYECCPDLIGVIDIQISKMFPRNPLEESASFCIVGGVAIEIFEELPATAHAALVHAAGNVRVDRIKRALKWIRIIMQDDALYTQRLSKIMSPESTKSSESGLHPYSIFAPALCKAVMCLVFDESKQMCIPDAMDDSESSLIEDILFAHLLDKEFYKSVYSCLEEAIKLNPRRSLHHSIIKSINRVVCCNASLPAQFSFCQCFARLKYMADSIVKYFALKSLEDRSINPEQVSLDILLPTVWSSSEDALVVLGGGPLHQLVTSASSHTLISICSDFDLFAKSQLWDSPLCSTFLSSIGRCISSTGARDSIMSSMSLYYPSPIENSLLSAFPRFVSSFFLLSNRILQWDKSKVILSDFYKFSTNESPADVDSMICEFQSIASILRFAFETLSTLGQSFYAVLHQLTFSLLAEVPHQSGDRSAQLQCVLDWRQSILITRHHLKSQSGQSQTFESTHPYGDSSNITHLIHFPGASKIRIEFDQNCRTELESDFLQFLQADLVVGNLKYHGRPDEDECACWLPLLVQGEKLEAHFVSGVRTNDWGYKFTATPILATHWIQYEAVSENLLSLLNCAVASLFENDSSFVVPHSCIEMLHIDGPIPVLASPSEPVAQDEALLCVDAKDKVGKWYQAFIVDGSVLVDCESENVTIHFMGWDSKWDEVFPRSKYNTHIRCRSSCPVGPNGPETIEDVLKKYPSAVTRAHPVASVAQIIHKDPFYQCYQALESLPPRWIYGSYISHAISIAALKGSMHPLLLFSAKKMIERFLSHAQSTTTSSPYGIFCDSFPYNTVLVPLMANAVVAICCPALSVANMTLPVSSNVFNGIRDAVDRVMSVMELSSNEAFTRLVPAIEITSIMMLQAHLSPECFNLLLEEVEAHLEASLKPGQTKSFPHNADVLFVALSSNPNAIRCASLPKAAFGWEVSQMSCLSQVKLSTASDMCTANFTPVIGLPKQVSSLPSYLFSTLPLTSFVRPSDNCFEIDVSSGVESIGLTTLSRSELHLSPYLLEDGICSYVLHISTNDSSRTNLLQNCKLVSVLPYSSSNVVQPVNIVYRPSQRTATFTVIQSQSKWSHTFEDVPASEVFLFVKLRGAEECRSIAWRVLDDVVVQNESK